MISGKKIEQKIFEVLMVFSTGVIFLSLILILLTILVKGIPTLTWEMVSQPPGGGFYLGGDGGILNAIVGSLLLATGAVIFGLLLSLPVAIYLNVYRRKGSRFTNLTRLVLDVLWGIPSIVYGAFGFILMIAFGMKMSLLMGILTVGLLIFPILSRSIDEVFKNIPDELKFASYTLGATRFETSLKVVCRQGVPGILNAIIIAFGRAIGDAAAVIYTAGFTDKVPDSIMDPVATLPLTIFFQLGSPFKTVQDRAYASAMILTIIILIINILVRLINKRFSKHTIK